MAGPAGFGAEDGLAQNGQEFRRHGDRVWVVGLRVWGEGHKEAQKGTRKSSLLCLLCLLVADDSGHCRLGGGQLGEELVGMHAVFETGGEEELAHIIGGEPAQFGQPLLLRDAVVP